MCENKSLIGYSLNTVLYLFNCFLSFNSFLKLLISAIRDPLGLDMERFDFADFFLLIFFLKVYLKLEIYHFLHVFLVFTAHIYDFLSE